MRHSLLAVLGAVVFMSSCGNGLQERLQKMVDEFPGEVGIALICDGDTVCVNGDAHFPMFSVVKFHQALAVCEKRREETIFSPYDIEVTQEELKPDTWSPMRDAFPGGGYFKIDALLEYTLVQSDNNACDILFRNFASPAQVEEYIHSLGVADCGVAWTEDEQHADPARACDNWTTPLAAAKLLGCFYDNRDADEYSEFVWKTMAGCQTGAGRIPKYIAEKAGCIVHKTGTGGPLPDGGVMGINDIAVVVMPDGSHFELAVFIKNASCGPADCEELIARIADTCLISEYR